MGQNNVTGAGTITGRVTDATGAIVTDATITVTDLSTNIAVTVSSNSAGLYVVDDVKAGTYNITATKPGFRKSVIPQQEVTPGLALTINFSLEVGAVTETVQVQASAEAELQTLNSTMGSSLGGAEIMNLPTINRDVSGLVFFQPTVSPTFNGAEGNTTSGNVAGNMADQNTYLLDGGNNTDDMDGDRGTYVGSRSGVMPTPVESVEEFRVNTNNMTADFASSGGGQVMITTKRGTNQYHGSLYDFFQSDVLAANDWSNNVNGIAKPKSHYNRFGGAIGGPMLPDFLGGKTYFYLNFEGERYPRTGPISAQVPSDLLRQGIMQVRDASGNIVQYNLATSTVCGPNGNDACDPRGVGISPAISTLWNKYEPQPNSLSCGDKLNTQCFIGSLTYPLSTNFGVVRVDHDFGPKWRFFSSYRYFGEDNPTTNQVDIGGLVPGDKLGQPASQSSFPLEPRYLVTGVTTTISPSINNDFHFSYTRNFWQWDRLGAGFPQLAGVPAAINMPGDAAFGSALVPMNDDTQNTRPRLWDGHDYSTRDNLNWLRGTHLFQFGGEYLHQWFHFDRYDNVSGLLTQPKYIIGDSGIDFTANGGSYLPVACSTTVTTNCLPSSSLGTYESYYSMLAGMVDQAGTIVTRTGSDLNANPLGTPMRSYSIVDTYSLYFTDAWRIKPNLTLSYGLNYTVPMPPYELNRAQNVLVDQNNNPLSIQSYLANRQSYAENGQNYNPTIGFSPVASVGQKYPYAPYYGGLAPRVSIAWNPGFTSGWLAKIFGDKNTVIRAGYGRFYSHTLGIDQVSTPVLGDGFLNPISCSDPTTSGTCANSGTNPTNAWRLGVDGNVSPFPTITQTLQSPVQPGVNAPYEGINFFLDNNFRPASSDAIDISIQRQLKGNIILEVGYVGQFARNLYQGIDLNDVPWMMKLGGQTFAQAYDNVWAALQKGQTPANQPFFETALAGSSYCGKGGFSSCTAGVVANEKGNFLGEDVTNLWEDMDSSGSFIFGNSMLASTQCQICYGEASNGFSNYNALVVTAQKRMSSGLTLNANFTYGRSLGTLALNQAYVENNVNNPWNLNEDYGPQFWDRKFVFNLLATYNLPFGKGQRWANANPVAERVLGGWSISPILSMATGTPLDVYTGGQETGNGYVPNGCNAIPLAPMSYSTSKNSGVPLSNVVGPNGLIGINNDASEGGYNENLFSSSQLLSTYNNFRPFLLGIDGTCGGGGNLLRGQNRWNLDLGLTKDTMITERVGFQFYAQGFNVLNHMQWGDPYMNIQDPADWGNLYGQYGAQTLGGSGASANYTRIIQLGVRFRF
jgi:hypothetical protein